jgi:hypothetical protein
MPSSTRRHRRIGSSLIIYKSMAYDVNVVATRPTNLTSKNIQLRWPPVFGAVACSNRVPLSVRGRTSPYIATVAAPKN